MNRALLALLVMLVLFGNGLRSVISSAVFVSEGEFASFLSISVTKTSAIIEVLLGAVLLSLLVAPELIRRFSLPMLASGMCALASAASLGLALTFNLSPPVAERELAVIVLFPVIGFALASLAPIAQTWTGWGGEARRKVLTGTWAVAMPAAFLVTPQVVRIIAPRYGLDLFFAGFAAIPLAMIPGIWIASHGRPRLPQPPKAAAPGLMLPAIAALVAFEVLTMTTTLAGITSPYLWPAGAGLALSLVWLVRRMPARDAGPAQRAASDDRRYTLAILAFLFLANIATTGFYDTAFLFLHSCSNTLIADRATLSALAQVVAVMATTAILARHAWHDALMAVGTACAFVGLTSYMLYFDFPLDPVFVVSRAVTGFGTGMLTTAAIFAITRRAQPGSGLALFTAFVIIIGTEFGLEMFETLTQITGLVQGGTATPYAAIFLVQSALMIVAIAPLSRAASLGAPRGAVAAGPDPARS